MKDQYEEVLEEELTSADLGTQGLVMEATAQAKISAGRSTLAARIKKAREVNDPPFDRSGWDMAKWEKTLVDVGDNEEVADVGQGKETEVEVSRTKDAGTVANEVGGTSEGNE